LRFFVPTIYFNGALGVSISNCALFKQELRSVGVRYAITSSGLLRSARTEM
jgi:hypothetical protein